MVETLIIDNEAADLTSSQDDIFYTTHSGLDVYNVNRVTTSVTQISGGEDVLVPTVYTSCTQLPCFTSPAEVQVRTSHRDSNYLYDK